MSLRYTTWQYGELWWAYKTCTFKNHTNLLAYLANWQLYTLESGFPDTITHQGTHFLGFVQVFSALTVIKKKPCQNGLLLKCSCVCCRSLNYMHGHIDDLPCSISTLYVTRVINYSRPTMVPLCSHILQATKGGWGLGTRLALYVGMIAWLRQLHTTSKYIWCRLIIVEMWWTELKKLIILIIQTLQYQT